MHPAAREQPREGWNLARDQVNDDYDPGPPGPPQQDYQKIGAFLHVFSVCEKWIDNYLQEHGQCNDMLSLSLSVKIEIWRIVAREAEPNRPIEDFYCLLKELSKDRNAIAHALWQDGFGSEQLLGSHRKRTIGSHDLSQILEKARRCWATMEFWV
jgi:hypothetical protein